MRLLKRLAWVLACAVFLLGGLLLTGMDVYAEELDTAPPPATVEGSVGVDTPLEAVDALATAPPPVAQEPPPEAEPVTAPAPESADDTGDAPMAMAFAALAEDPGDEGLLQTAAATAPTYSPGFHNIGGKVYYYDGQGKLVTGYFEANGLGYFADPDGSLKSGLFWDWPAGSVRYADPMTLQLQKAWVEAEQATYYMDDSYLAVRAWQTIGGEPCFFNDSFQAADGLTKVGGETFLFNKGRSTGSWFTKVGEQVYFFESKTKGASTNLFKVGSAAYFADDNGALRSGLFWDWPVPGIRYADPNSLQLARGWAEADTHEYYFDSNYLAVRETRVVDGVRRSFDSNGIAKKGLQHETAGTFYYDRGASVGSWFMNIDGKVYFFANTNTPASTGYFKVGSAAYFGEADGALKTGLFWDWPVPGIRYADPVTLQLKQGWAEVDNHQYFFDANHLAARGRQYVDGAWRVFDDNGIAKRGLLTESGGLFYYDKGVNAGNWFMNIGGKVYFFASPGAAASSGFFTVNGHTYHAGSDHALSVGLFWDSNTSVRLLYYADPSSLTLSTGWVTTGGYSYFFKSDFAAAMGWNTIDGVDAFFDPNNAHYIGGAPYPGNRHSDAALERFARDVAALINQDLTKHHHAQLVYAHDMSHLALMRAVETADKYAHTRPDGRNWDTMMSDHGYTSGRATELIDHGHTTASSLVHSMQNQSWYNAQVRNGKYAQIGVGVFRASDGSLYSTIWLANYFHR